MNGSVKKRERYGQKEAQRRDGPPYTLLLVVVGVSVIGTYLSTSLYSTSTLSFRSRLPASALSALQSTDNTTLDLPYFADKRNLFNRYFVKFAWAWSLLAAFAHILARELFPAQPSTTGTSTAPTGHDSKQKDSPGRRLLVDALRWSTASFWWYFLTQKTWFFGTGPSVAHRLLVLTGAQCVPHSALATDQSAATTGQQQTPNLAATAAPAASTTERCANGMYFSGGHDVSGHTFLLVLSTLLLFETVRSSTRHFSQGSALPLPHFVTMALAYVLMTLWIGMLAATSLFFHSPAEKMSGLAFGLLAWWASRGGKNGW